MSDEAGAIAWKQVRTARASEHVVSQIKEAFFAGMRAGDWLGTETELAQRFGVSRITVRDAIRSLEAQGIVDVKVGARGGLRIAEGDPDRFADALSIQLHLTGISWDELTEAMRAVEPMTASLAAQRATPEDVERMRAAVADCDRHSGEPARFTERALDFHLLVAEASGNRALRASVRALRSVQMLKFRPNTSTEVAHRVTRMHGRIVDAIAAGDAEAARAAMNEHLELVSKGGSRNTAV
ncbi:FadR/GntR family transcriptional regulator [Pseudonocardia acaciae]|uniref:FadR/GntR family transcriptional regulator n=1 Tax=Pseudonocardia acaciae TaxID=551276 RepID=UPI0004913A27|nr:FCD domain-containing protein [Pseudonocardia acaciae]